VYVFVKQQQFYDFRVFWPNANENTILAKYSAKQTGMYPETIIGELIHHPQAQRGSRAALMVQNMSQIWTKNTLNWLKKHSIGK
jgi:hypothetical protein